MTTNLTPAEIVDQHRQAARWVGNGVTVECTCGHESHAVYDIAFPLTEERNNHRDADRKHAAHVTEQLAAQEPTDAEVLAALNAHEATYWGDEPEADLSAFSGDRVSAMRAALAAARAVRQEKR